jgi:hypothetical protein
VGGVQQGLEDEVERVLAARGHHHVVGRHTFNAVLAGELLGNGGPRGGVTGGGHVPRLTGVDRRDGRTLDRFGRVEVGLAGGERKHLDAPLLEGRGGVHHRDGGRGLESFGTQGETHGATVTRSEPRGE